MTVTIVGSLSPTSRGTLSNSACAHGAEPDPNPADNCAQNAATVITSANVQVTKTIPPVPVTAVQTFALPIVATNSGPTSATNVNITDSVPAGVTVTLATSTQGSCAPEIGRAPCRERGGPATLLPGQSMKVTIVGTVSPTARGTLANDACADGS